MENKEMKYCWVYLDYREDKETGEIQFECPEVYATEEAALDKWGDETSLILESLCGDGDDEGIYDLQPGEENHYFHLNTDKRLITIYVKKVEVKQ